MIVCCEIEFQLESRQWKAEDLDDRPSPKNQLYTAIILSRGTDAITFALHSNFRSLVSLDLMIGLKPFQNFISTREAAKKLAQDYFGWDSPCVPPL